MLAVFQELALAPRTCKVETHTVLNVLVQSRDLACTLRLSIGVRASCSSHLQQPVGMDKSRFLTINHRIAYHPTATDRQSS